LTIETKTIHISYSLYLGKILQQDYWDFQVK